MRELFWCSEFCTILAHVVAFCHCDLLMHLELSLAYDAHWDEIWVDHRHLQNAIEAIDPQIPLFLRRSEK